METTQLDPVRLEAFATRAIADIASSYTGVMVSLGHKLGLYRVMAGAARVERTCASTVICCAHALSEGGRLVLGAQAGPRRLAEVFRKAGLSHFRLAAQTPFNLICELRQ